MTNGTSDQGGSATDGAGGPELLEHQGHWPPLKAGEWITFAVLAGLLAAANIYTTLLIGWGDTGSIIAVLASVVLLGVISRHKPSVHTLNLGQTMVSAGGSVGFAVASYAAVRILNPDFDPPYSVLIPLFAAMGILGALVGSTVRKYMVRYFFPSGTACAVIQKAVSAEVKEGERNRPVFLLKVWGGLASLLTIPTKITLQEGGEALLKGAVFTEKNGFPVGVGADPLYYGIGLVVGPRIGLGMLIGALAGPYWLFPALEGAGLIDEFGDWLRWLAIAVLTLPTFATIVFAYLFRTPAVVPPGFTPDATRYERPANATFVHGMIAAGAALAIGWAADRVFDIPWHVSIITMIIAWPLCVVNGRVTGDTDINPVRLVAIVILSGFFWLVAGAGAITLLGMAVVAGTLAAVAVDMMQDYRTGYLVEANPVHQTTVQFFGALVGAVVAVPVLSMLVGELGIGADSKLKAPGAQVWAAMADTMTGGFEPSSQLITWIIIVSIVGCVYAFLTVWPRSAPWMPSIFGIGIGMLVGIEASAGIFLGGVLKWLVTLWYLRGKAEDARLAAQDLAGNDTMMAGASVFAAGAVISILVIVVVKLLEVFGSQPFFIAG